MAASQPPSFIFSARPNAVQELLLQSWGIHTLSEDEDDPGTGLTRFLKRLLAVKEPGADARSHR